jgi:hypothetical protein
MEAEGSQERNFESGGRKMSTLDQLVSGARQSVVKPKSPLLAEKSKILSGTSETLVATLVAALWNQTSPHVYCSSPSPNTLMTGLVPNRRKVVGQDTALKESVLALIRKDRSIPTDLHLKKGSIKELDEGVFVKKREDGILEIYVSEE